MAVASTAAKPCIFVSYSRTDVSFANELVAGLEFDGGFDVSIDRHSIKSGEDWRGRLGRLIEAADTIVFILSPASAQSEICGWEVDEANRLKKRILPVLHLPLGTVKPPPALGAINYVDFTQSPTLIAGIKGLATALRTDLDWLRESTRLLTLALDWERSDRRKNRLLSGEDIVEAKQWLAVLPEGEEVTELHRDFIKASEENEVIQLDIERKRLQELAEAQRRSAEAARRAARRTMVGLFVASILAMVASGLGIWAFFERRNALIATTRAQQALEMERKSRGFTRQLLSTLSTDRPFNNSWPTNTILSVCFFGGDLEQRFLVRDLAQEWAKGLSIVLAGFQSCDTQDSNVFRSHIRIAFDSQGLSWSLLGKQATNKDLVAPDKPSMVLSLQKPINLDVNRHSITSTIWSCSRFCGQPDARKLQE